MRKSATACLVVSLVISFSWASADSLFNNQAAKKGSLIADSRQQFEPGDIITILVKESIKASTTADTNTQKQSDVKSEAAAADNEFLIAGSRGNMGGMNILNAPELPNWDIQAENEHQAGGATRRSNQLEMTITCTVTKVYENGNIEIAGDKRVKVNREDSIMKITGLVRSKDVTPANTIDSSQVANANIELEGKGPLWNSQRRGWLTRFLDWFSPY